MYNPAKTKNQTGAAIVEAHTVYAFVSSWHQSLDNSLRKEPMSAQRFQDTFGQPHEFIRGVAQFSLHGSALYNSVYRELQAQ
jgi:hypothetical protein